MRECEQLFQQHISVIKRLSDTIIHILQISFVYGVCCTGDCIYAFDPLVIPLPVARMFALGSICFTYTTYYNMYVYIDIHLYIFLQRPNYLLNGKSAGREPIDPFPIRYCATLPDPTAKIQVTDNQRWRVPPIIGFSCEGTCRSWDRTSRTDTQVCNHFILRYKKPT